MLSAVDSYAIDHYCDAAPLLSRDGDRALLWLEGEQDIATAAVLKDALARVVSADNSDLIVDLSGVTFMSTATIDELIRGRDILLARSRNMTLRSPSRCARRLLELCRLTDLVEPAGSGPPSSSLRAPSRAAGLPASDRSSTAEALRRST